jgi:hypothetical protein
MDRGRVAPRQTSRRPGASSCRGRACRPSARRRLGNGRIDATRVGGHRERGNGRFRPGCATAAARHHDAHGLQIAADRFAPDAGRPFDAPQRPAQSPQRQDLVVFVVSQDVAHAVRNAAFLVGVNASSRYSKWPVFSCPLIAGFGCPPTVDAKMPVWLSSRCGPRAARCTGNDSRVPDPLRPAMLISLNSMAALRGQCRMVHRAQAASPLRSNVPDRHSRERRSRRLPSIGADKCEFRYAYASSE